MSEAIWHEAESGPYTPDEQVWLELAAEAPGNAVLDIGAGLGRTAIPLAEAGHDVTALDIDAELLEGLRARAAERGVTVETVTADAQDFDLGRTFGLVTFPQNSIQLLDDRPGCWRAMARHTEPGGLVAVAISPRFTSFNGPNLPKPDIVDRDGHRYISQATALRSLGDRVAIDRLRIVVAPDGKRTATEHSLTLHRVTVPLLAEEAEAAGLEHDRTIELPESQDYVPAVVAVFRQPS